jgi:hypothetical protein
MKIQTLPLLIFAALPALAQERWQMNLAFNDVGRIKETTALGGSYLRFTREQKPALAIQVGYSAIDLGCSDLSFVRGVSAPG